MRAKEPPPPVTRANATVAQVQPFADRCHGGRVRGSRRRRWRAGAEAATRDEAHEHRATRHSDAQLHELVEVLATTLHKF